LQLRAIRYIDYKSCFGEVSEWLNEPVSKTGVPIGYRGFESRPLRWVPAKRGPSSLRYSRKGRLTAERRAVIK
jgi:hypothetical protein